MPTPYRKDSTIDKKKREPLAVPNGIHHMMKARIGDDTNKKKRELLPSRQQPLLIPNARKGTKAYCQGRHPLAS
ncbi:predicted protein [Lichtheimia corymbifera JMRC:FSU:9682]|uniref:Uncharacterized protein n=1 Tax=Lichtheimia corymbifera JMRC:FSU:9682 TaxID=1263082 RepID=A0A068SFN4_9FUNG|nr:predicted protein [Lichtheimia corymbifera JMRC:FSU:9682]